MNINKILLLVVAFFSAEQALACGNGDSVIKNRSEDQDCALERTPLTRCEKYSTYIEEDGRLNKAYVKLMQDLATNDRLLLRKAQRKWLAWRDEKCEEVDVEANCENGACAGVAHDRCIVGLTRKRATEIIRFIQNPASAKKNEYAFTTDYDPFKYY